MNHFPVKLPKILSLLPLRGIVMLPGQTLPVPIISQEQQDLLQKMMQKQEMVGLIQPREADEQSDNPKLFRTGCAGRVIGITEIDDEHAFATIMGVCRFIIQEEVAETANFRQAVVSYDRFYQDLMLESDMAIDRDRLLRAMRPYFEQLEISPNWDEIDGVSNQRLINTLTLVCPFDPLEKQALLESPNVKDQSQVMTMLFEIGSMAQKDSIRPIMYH